MQRRMPGDFKMIFRSEHLKNYTAFQNELIKDSRLSFQTRALMIYILSLPDDWNFSIKGLASQTGMSERKVMELVKELKKHGYIVQKSRRNDRGKIEGWEWDVFEVPVHTVEKSQCGSATVWTNHSVEQPQCGKHVPILNTKYNQVLNEQSTKDISVREKSKKQFTPPTLEEVRAYCIERGNNVDPEKFFDYYTAGQWKDAKGNRVKNWKQKVITWEKKDEAKKAKTQPIAENPFTKLRREEGFE